MNDQEFLEALRDYIEQVEVQLDGEFGWSRKVSQLVDDGVMPDVYAEVLRRLAVSQASVRAD